MLAYGLACPTDIESYINIDTKKMKIACLVKQHFFHDGISLSIHLLFIFIYNTFFFFILETWKSSIIFF